MSDVTKHLGWVLVTKTGSLVDWYCKIHDEDPTGTDLDQKRTVADQTDPKDAPHRWQPVVAAPARDAEAGREFYEALRAADPRSHPDEWDGLTALWKKTYTLAATRMLVAVSGAQREPLTKREVDDIVYRCRQAGDDSTYTVIAQVEEHHGVKSNKEGRQQ